MSDTLGADQSSTLGMVIKGRSNLTKLARKYMEDVHCLQEIRLSAKSMLESLERTGNKLCVAHRVATFLDPRFRGTGTNGNFM